MYRGTILKTRLGPHKLRVNQKKIGKQESTSIPKWNREYVILGRFFLLYLHLDSFSYCVLIDFSLALVHIRFPNHLCLVNEKNRGRVKNLNLNTRVGTLVWLGVRAIELWTKKGKPSLTTVRASPILQQFFHQPQISWKKGKIKKAPNPFTKVVSKQRKNPIFHQIKRQKSFDQISWKGFGR